MIDRAVMFVCAAIVLAAVGWSNPGSAAPQTLILKRVIQCFTPLRTAAFDWFVALWKGDSSTPARRAALFRSNVNAAPRSDHRHCEVTR